MNSSNSKNFINLTFSLLYKTSVHVQFSILIGL